jgi:exodeoxyribonuclease VII small subunit
MTKITLTYEKALGRIEEIISKIEAEELNVDELAKHVKEASDLLKFCKSKLFETEEEIEKILKEIDEGKERG